MQVPTVSIAILSYQRVDAVSRVIESALAQDYPNTEVIVVDNGSGPDLVNCLRARFPAVRLIALPHNIGTAARNRAIEAARGEIIVTLDNDVYFDGPGDLWRIVAALDRHPRAGCVVFRVYHPATGRLHLRDWCHPRPPASEGEEFETHYLTEGAAAFRSEVFTRVEPYWHELFIGHEGFDLAVRMMDAGYELWYVPEIRVWHMASLETRQDWRPFYYYSRNLFAVVARNYPWLRGFAYMLPRLAVLAAYATRAGTVRAYLRGVWDGIEYARKLRACRHPLNRKTLARIRAIKHRQPGPLARFLFARGRIMPLRSSPVREAGE